MVGTAHPTVLPCHLDRRALAVHLSSRPEGAGPCTCHLDRRALARSGEIFHSVVFEIPRLRCAALPFDKLRASGMTPHGYVAGSNVKLGPEISAQSFPRPYYARLWAPILVEWSGLHATFQYWDILELERIDQSVEFVHQGYRFWAGLPDLVRTCRRLGCRTTRDTRRSCLGCRLSKPGYCGASG